MAPTRQKPAAFWPGFILGGAVAQLGERLVRNEEVRGSTPLGSTSLRSLRELRLGGPQPNSAQYVRTVAVRPGPRDKGGGAEYDTQAMTANDPTLSRLLHHKAYVRFLYVRVAASVALQIQVVAVGWQMYALTGSPFRLGLIGLVQFIPVVSFFLLTGHVADRYDRRIVTFIGEVVEALAVAVLAVASAMGRLTPDLLLAMAFVVGTGRAFEQPSVQSVLPNIVPAAVLPRAIADSTSASQAAIIAGPALG